MFRVQVYTRKYGDIEELARHDMLHARSGSTASAHRDVTESARAHSYFFSYGVQKTCQFWLTF